jgi:flavin reductase (DIM6/NTAB) family NADH-FMN oxidoreductase RutF/DNA-binding IclR family transcriptional regulator
MSAHVIDDRQFREVLGHYPTGVALVTGIDPNGSPVGMIVGSFTSVSLEPPLVAYLPTRTSYVFGQLREASTFCINVLSAEQEALCRLFASRAEDKWDGVEWRSSPSGAPILAGAVAWIECATESITEAGDHFLVMGRVQDLGVEDPSAPLLFFQGGYGRFTMSSLVATNAPDLVSVIRMAEIARQDIEELSTRLGVACDVVASVGSELVFVGSATGAGSSSRSPVLGTRIPLMVPLGEQYVAWGGPEAAARWIARSGVTDAHVVARLHERLALARARGWSMSRIPADDELPLYEALREYSDGELTPAADRALRVRIVQWTESYDPIEVDSAGVYDAHSLAVPVLGREGQPLLIIRVGDLPRPATGAQIIEWIAQTEKAAAIIAARLDPSRMAIEQEPVGWG